MTQPDSLPRPLCDVRSCPHLKLYPKNKRPANRILRAVRGFIKRRDLMDKKKNGCLIAALCVVAFGAASCGTVSLISGIMSGTDKDTQPAATTSLQTQTESLQTETETQQTQTDAPTETPTEEETQTDTPTEADTAPPELTLGQKNAVRSAVQYIETLAFSHGRLIEQLEYSGFTHEEAVYGADNCGADWNAEAAEAAKNYIDTLALSRERLIEQLLYDKFTQEQAEYGASSVGY